VSAASKYAGAGAAPASLAAVDAAPLRAGDMPWRAAGLDERQAAAHLLSRFTFGARPGDVDRVLARGLERWFEDQLAAAAPERAIAERLASLRTPAMTAQQMAETYPNAGYVLAQARREGVLPARERANEPGTGGASEETNAEGTSSMRDEGQASEEAARNPRRDPELRQKLLAFATRKGYHRQGELFAELLTQKLVRAVYAENQLAEVMTDFWFNHFNVSLTDPEARVYVLAYERDAIRPHALGRFTELLGATARHPAMLLYLDNARSVAPAGSTTTLARRLDAGGPGAAGGSVAGRGFGRPGRLGGIAGRSFGNGTGGSFGSGFGGRAGMRGGGIQSRRPTGLNENYARELLELHTLGVDGGYTQGDVVEVARALTGWTVLPPRAVLGDGIERRLARVQAMGLGFVREGAFVFRPDTHDAGAKTVLGTRLAAGRGVEDGEQVLSMLVAHPSTARHLATKVAQRFMADAPPSGLVDRLASAFASSGGDTRAVLRALARSPELWAPEARAQKVKSPFELAASALRALDAEVTSPAAVVDWVARMGQPLYRQQAPTGWPDRAEAWVNTGSLLARMNFGLELVSGRLPGVRLDLAALAGAPEPESARTALAAYAALLLPERVDSPALDRLAALVEEPGLSERLAAQDATAASAATGMDMSEQRLGRWEEPFPEYQRQRTLQLSGISAPPDDSLVARVVGVLVGSPEFQRR
jgi:uncharacterized protein (DUF1800 family)